MKNNRRIIASVCWMVIGAALTGAGCAGWVDEFWSGMGTALFAVGVLQMIRWIRYRTDGAYKAKVDVETHDERNRFISGRAWAWAGYVYVLLGALACVGFRIAGSPEMSLAAGMSVCLMMVLYWISWLLLRRKY